MSIRAKIILFFALLTSFTVVSLTMYSTYFQRKTYFENERLAQQQVISLLRNYVAAQYYNYVDDQISEIISLRSDLENKAILVKSQILKILNSGFSPRLQQDYVFTLLGLLNSGLKEAGVNLVVVDKERPVIAPEGIPVDQLSSVNQRYLLPLLYNTAQQQSINGYFLFLYDASLLKRAIGPHDQQNFYSHVASQAPSEDVIEQAKATSEIKAPTLLEPETIDKDQNMVSIIDDEALATAREQQTALAKQLQKRYLSYIFTINPEFPYAFALIQNINELFSYYDISNATMVERMRGHFDNLHLSLNGEALVVDAHTGKLLLSTHKDQPLFKEMPENLQSWCEQAAVVEKDRLKHINVEQNESVDFSTFETGEIQIGDTTYIVSCTYYKPLDWYIINVLDRDIIMRPASENALVQLAFSQLLLFFAIFTAILWGRKITHSLIQISRKAAVLSATNLSDPHAVAEITSSIVVEGKDEIAKLSQAFNRMGISLSNNINQLLTISAVQSRMEGELKAAREIQLGMLPEKKDLPSSKSLLHAAFLQPAKEVGGDFYDIFRLDDDHIAYTIGDVSDKGVPAALFMSMTMNLARTCLFMHLSPSETMHIINDRLSERNPNMMFVTMFIAVMSESTGKVEACNAGHCPPILLHSENEELSCEQWEEINGPAVGPMSGMEYSQYEKKLTKNDLLLLYTDGVSEAQNDKQEFYQVDSILAFARGHFEENPETFTFNLNQAVADFRGKYVQTDDITIVSLRRQ